VCFELPFEQRNGGKVVIYICYKCFWLDVKEKKCMLFQTVCHVSMGLILKHVTPSAVHDPIGLNPQAHNPIGWNHQTHDPIGWNHQTHDPIGWNHQALDLIGWNHQAHDPTVSNHQTHDPIGWNHQTHDPIVSNHQTHDPIGWNHQTHDTIGWNHQTHDPIGWKCEIPLPLIIQILHVVLSLFKVLLYACGHRQTVDVVTAHQLQDTEATHVLQRAHLNEPVTTRRNSNILFLLQYVFCSFIIIVNCMGLVWQSLFSYRGRKTFLNATWSMYLMKVIIKYAVEENYINSPHIRLHMKYC